MSVSFYGRGPDGTAVALDLDDPAHLNLANANARALLLLLGLGPGPDLWGEVTTPDARRAIMRARASFNRRAGSFTRESSDTRRPGRCRIIQGGIDEGYLARRLDDFERFVGAIVERGAVTIGWG